MKRILNRPLTLRHLLLVAVAALTLGIGATAVAVSSKGGPDEAGKVNLGTEGGYNYRSNQVSTPSVGQYFVSVKCKGGKHVTGGGVYSSGTYNEQNINSSYPFDGTDGDSVPDDGWAGWVDHFEAESETITAYAVCKG